MTSIALVLTLTRGAWVGWIAGFVSFILLRRVRWAMYLVPLVIIAATFAPMSIFARFVSTFDVKQSSNLDRIRMAQAGVEMVRDHPILGVGPGNIKETYPLYREPDAPRFRIPHLHNNIVQISAERGLLALTGYLLLIIFALRLFLQRDEREASPRTWSSAGTAIVVGLTCAGLFEFNFGDSEVLLHLLDLIALGIAFKALGPRDAAQPALFEAPTAVLSQ
jgi:putative inorganic carbon (HCO3(-)) transporter